jgi:hypothetical protein
VFGEDALAVRLAFNELHRFNAAEPAGGQREPADAAEGVDHSEHHQLPPAAATRSRSPRRVQFLGNPPTLRSAKGWGFTFSTGTSTS